MDYSPDYFSLPSRTESSSAPPPRTTDNSHFGLQPQGQAELQLDPVVWQHPQYANYLTPQSAHLPIHTGHYRRRSPASASPTSGFTVATASSIATERARMGPKRSSSGVSSGDAPPSSKVKINQPTSADAGHGKPRAKGHPGRTGQACDRCKNRKIKCDDETQACNNCRVAEAECLVTDRNTGKALPRGYLERLELQNVAYHRHIEELTEQLRQVGITPRPAPALASHGSGPIAAGSTTVQGLGWNSSQGFHGEGMNTDPMAQAIMASIATSTSPSGPLDRSLYKEPPTFRTGCHGDNYLGVSSDKHVSNIYGTTLQLLGMKIDIADFPSSEMDQSGLHNKSYESLLSSMFNVNKRITRVELPPRSEGVQGAEIYFVSTNSFLPLLHKPTFMTLLSRFYDDPTFKPSAAESVMVHMVFAIYYFQSAARNDDTEKPAKTQRSNLHYHYSLGFFHDLMLGHSLQDIQALGLICSHLRNFPKPGASWMITKISLTLASELGLHRSAQRWTSPLAQENPLELEMRKRVFYSIFSLHILLSGKLGRPMGMRLDDFDIEFPGAIDDSQISESGIDMSRPAKCSFEVGLAAAKWQILSLELYTTLYTVKRNLNDLPAKRHALEAKLERWYEELSPEMKINPSQSVQTDGQGMVFALWLQMLYLEFRMLLYHPSIDINDSAKSYRSSLEICQQTANQMRWSLGQLMQLRSLDTTWYNASVDVMAITVTLFAYYERKDELSYSDVEDLSNQMDQWLVIISAVGGLLGSGNRLNEAVSVVSARTIAAIKNHLDMRAANLGTGRRHSSHSPAGSHRYISPETAMGDATEPYQPSQQYAYPDPNSISSTVPYSGQNQMYNQNPYNNEGNLNVRSLAHVAAAATEAARDQPEQKVAFGLFPGQGSAETYGPGPQAWATWTRSVTDNLAAQDAYSASALMELGGRDVSAAEQQSQANLNASAAGPDGNATAQAMTGSHQHWPQMLFDVSGGNQHNG